jgi:hypothetical protein
MTPLPHPVDACSLLCHEEAKHLHVLTVEVWTGDLERMAAKRKRLHSIPVGCGTFSGDSSLHPGPHEASACKNASWPRLRMNVERKPLQWQIGDFPTHDNGT